MVTAMAMGTTMATTTATAMMTARGQDADGDGYGEDGSNDTTELQSMFLKDCVRHASSMHHSIPGLRRGLTRHTELSRNVPSFLGDVLLDPKKHETQVHTYIGTRISIPQHFSTAVRLLMG